MINGPQVFSQIQVNDLMGALLSPILSHYATILYHIYVTNICSSEIESTLLNLNPLLLAHAQVSCPTICVSWPFIHFTD